MKESTNSKGVLSTNYADDRKTKPELKFRLKTRARMVYNVADKYLQKTNGLKILDIGAAEGRTILEMNSLFSDTTFLGIEYSNELISAAGTLPDNVTIIQGDAMNHPESVEPNSYDLISALAILEHLESPVKAIEEVYKALKPGGIFVATCPVPAWDDISNKLGLLKEDHHETDMHKGFMTEIMQRGGVELIDYQRFMLAPISFLPYLHVPVNPAFSLSVDRFFYSIKIFNWLFVNQVIIGKKPH